MNSETFHPRENWRRLKCEECHPPVQQQSVKTFEFLTGRRCPAVDNNGLLWLFPIWSNLELSHHWRAKAHQTITFALGNSCLLISVGFFAPHIRLFWVLTDLETRNKHSSKHDLTWETVVGWHVFHKWLRNGNPLTIIMVYNKYTSAIFYGNMWNSFSNMSYMMECVMANLEVSSLSTL